MKKIIYLLTFLNGLLATGQKSHFDNLSSETIAFYNQAKHCWENTESSCIPFYKKMVSSARTKKECVPCAEIELARGYVYESSLDSSLVHLKNVLKDAKKQKPRLQLELEQDAYNIMAVVYSQKGNTNKAIQLLAESGKRIDKLGNEEQANILKANLGVLYVNIGNYEKGIEFLKAALNGFKKLGINKNRAALAANIASAYSNLNKTDSVRAWAKFTIKAAKENQDHNNEISGYYLTGASFEKQNPDSAMYYVDKSISMIKSKKNPNLLAIAYNIKGNIFAEKSDYPQARKYYLESIQLFRSIGKPSGMYAPLRSLAEEAYIHKDYPTAAKYLSEYIVHMDSVASEDNKKMVHEYSEKYEAERKEKQIAEQALKIQKQTAVQLYSVLAIVIFILIIGVIFLYYRKTQQFKLNQIRQEREKSILNSFIEGEEAERNRISYELHDGVAAMIGAAKLSLDTLPHLAENDQKAHLEKVKTMLENTHNDVRHIAHNLLPHRLKSEGIVKATEQFASEINETRLVNISVIDENSQPGELPHQLQLLIFRVIQELVNNILKHSQAHNAMIAFSRNAEGLQIKIADDGIGYDRDLNSASQGIYSVTHRINAVGGTFQIAKSDDKGTVAIITINNF